MDYVDLLRRFIGKTIWVNLDSTVFSMTVRDVKRLTIAACDIKPQKVDVGGKSRSPIVFGIIADEGIVAVTPPNSASVLLESVILTYPTYTVTFSEKPIPVAAVGSPSDDTSNATESGV